MSRCLSAPDYIAASRTSTVAKTKMFSVVRIQQKEYLVLCTVEEGLANTCKRLMTIAHVAGKALHLLDRNEMAYILQTPDKSLTTDI